MHVRTKCVQKSIFSQNENKFTKCFTHLSHKIYPTHSSSGVFMTVRSFQNIGVPQSLQSGKNQSATFH